MRIAIVLVGHVRTWDLCKQSFIDTFGSLPADIYLSTYNVKYGHHPHIQGRIGDFGDDLITQEEILEMFKGFNLRGLIVEDQKLVEKEIAEQMLIVPQHHQHPSTLAQYRKMNQALSMVQHVEDQENFEYDYVIKTRCDMIYTEEARIITRKITGWDVVVVDSGNIFPNDCFLYSNRNNIFKISKFMLQEFFVPQFKDSGIDPPHRMLHNSFKHYNLHASPHKIMDHVIRRGGKKEYY